MRISAPTGETGSWLEADPAYRCLLHCNGNGTKWIITTAPPQTKKTFLKDGKTKRTRSITRSKGGTGFGNKVKPETKRAAGHCRAERSASIRPPLAQLLMIESRIDNLGALQAKIASVLATRPQCFITHPAELSSLKTMTPDELRAFAEKNGWRSVRRVGGRQIEFYNDATVRPDLA
jgi:hypothetical protein